MMLDQHVPAHLDRDGVAVPATAVSVYEAIFRRAQPSRFDDRPVPRDSLERMLAAARRNGATTGKRISR